MFAFLLELFCFIQIFSPVVPDTSSSVPDPREPEFAQESDPGEDAAALFSMIREVSPGFYLRLSLMPRQALLEALMKALGCSARAEFEKGLPAPPDRKPAVFPGRLLEGKRVFYLRMDDLGPETLSGAKDELLQSRASSPAAMILDLRNANCADQDVIHALELFSGDSAAAEWYRTRPLAVLISEKTTGGAAFLAAYLSRSSVFEKAVTVGRPTSGCCFPSVFATAGGVEWRIPCIPENLADSPYPAGRLEPDIPAAGPSGQIEFGKLGDPAAVSGDAVLRTALDLTLTLSVLKNPAQPAEKP